MPDDTTIMWYDIYTKLFSLMYDSETMELIDSSRCYQYS